MRRSALLFIPILWVILAASGARAQDPSPPSVEVVSASVNPAWFSPNGDDRLDVTEIRIAVQQPVVIVVRLVDRDDQVRRVWNREAGPGSDAVVAWNGRVGGRTLTDGRYGVDVEATDEADVRHADTASLVLDTKPPRVTWLEISPEPLRDQSEIRFRFLSRDRSPTLRASGIVLDRVGRIGRLERTVVGSGEGAAIDWRARYGGGGRLFPGRYTTRLAVTDQAGNTGRDSASWRARREIGVAVYNRLLAAGNRVALTFDDCAESGAWGRILTILRHRGVGAAFFCTGNIIALDRDLARSTTAGGHTVGSHGWDHARLVGLPESESRWRMNADARAWWEVSGDTTFPYFRPPYGAYDGNVLAAAAATSHPRFVMWDVDPLDWQRPGAPVIASRVVSQARAGSIILLHTIGQTADALPAILDGLAGRGLRPVALAELFRAAGFR